MRVIGSRILVLPIKEDKQINGIFIPEKLAKFNKGVIQQIGNKVEKLKVGQTILYYKDCGAKLNYRGDDLIILREKEDVVSTI